MDFINTPIKRAALGAVIGGSIEYYMKSPLQWNINQQNTTMKSFGFESNQTILPFGSFAVIGAIIGGVFI